MRCNLSLLRRKSQLWPSKIRFERCKRPWKRGKTRLHHNPDRFTARRPAFPQNFTALIKAPRQLSPAMSASAKRPLTLKPRQTALAAGPMTPPAVPTRLRAIPTGLRAVPTSLQAIPTRLPALPTRLPPLSTEFPVVPTASPLIWKKLPAISTRSRTVSTDFPLVPTRLQAVSTALPADQHRPSRPPRPFFLRSLVRGSPSARKGLLQPEERQTPPAESRSNGARMFLLRPALTEGALLEEPPATTSLSLNRVARRRIPSTYRKASVSPRRQPSSSTAPIFRSFPLPSPRFFPP